LIGTFSGHSSFIFSLCLLKNGFLASASFDGDIRIWRSINDFGISPGKILFEKTDAFNLKKVPKY
jgi:WD40 repeat protein